MKNSTFTKFFCVVLAALLVIPMISSCSLEQLAEDFLENLIDELEGTEEVEETTAEPRQTEPEKTEQTEYATPETEETETETDEPSPPPEPPVTWEDEYTPSYGETVYISKRQSAVPDEYYWRATLTGEMAKAYDELAAAAKRYEEYISISANVSFSDMEAVFRMYSLDHPESFWYMNGFSGRGYVNNIDAVVWGLCFDEAEIPLRKREVEEAAQKIVDTIPNGASDIEAELIIYDYLTQNLTYDLEADNAYNLYGALIGRRCVCQGFAEAFQYLCHMVGIPCIGMMGDATNGAGVTEAHKWNAVKIGGRWYPVDATFGAGGAFNYTQYFNNAKKIASNHKIHPALTAAPRFYADDAEYFNYFGLVFTEDDLYDTFMRATKLLSENRNENSLVSHVVMRAEDMYELDSVRQLLDESEGEYLENIIADYNEVFSDSLVVWDYDFSDEYLIVHIVRIN